MSEILVQELNGMLKFRGIPPLFYTGMAFPEFSKASAILSWAGSAHAENISTERWKEVLGSMGINWTGLEASNG